MNVRTIVGMYWMQRCHAGVLRVDLTCHSCRPASLLSPVEGSPGAAGEGEALAAIVGGVAQNWLAGTGGGQRALRRWQGEEGQASEIARRAMCSTG